MFWHDNPSTIFLNNCVINNSQRHFTTIQFVFVCMHILSVVSGPMLSSTVMMLSDIVESVMLLKDEARLITGIRCLRRRRRWFKCETSLALPVVVDTLHAIKHTRSRHGSFALLHQIWQTIWLSSGHNGESVSMLMGQTDGSTDRQTLPRPLHYAFLLHVASARDCGTKPLYESFRTSEY